MPRCPAGAGGVEVRQPVYRVALAFVAAFAGLMLYLGFFAVAEAPQLRANPLNPRGMIWEKDVRRGGILDRNGEILATAVGGRRLYPQGEVAAHVTGYLSERHGKAGLEAAANAWLAGLTGREAVRNKLRRLAGIPGEGYDVILTLDLALQAKAMELLDGRRGAIVVMDPRTGNILALASAPSFNPERIEEEWSALNQSREAPLLNRALDGLYPPGSVAKLFTAAAALNIKPEFAGKKYFCPGYLVIEGRRLGCSRPHGWVNLKEALQYSCNVAVGSLAQELGGRELSRAAPNFGFNRQIPFDLPTATSSFPRGDLAANALAEAAIGQGKVLVTPLHIALLTAAIANGGAMVEPRLIAAVRDSRGRVVPLRREHRWLAPMPEPVARFLVEAMVAVVERGTGRRASLPNVEVAGKTGTAENPHGAPHAWFTGFAPASSPQVVVTVVLENAGSGGEAAAPVAQKLLAAALARQERVK